MKKNLLRMFAVCVACFLVAQPADAQFSKILKKVKKVAETVANGNNAQTTQKQGEIPAEFKVSKSVTASGATVENPFSQIMDVQLVGAYGQSTSQNYGTISLVLKLKMIANKSRVGLGGEENFPSASQAVKTMCVDQDGNTYFTYGGMSSEYFDVTEGIYVKINLGDRRNTTFIDVKKSAIELQVIKLAVYVDAGNRGHITFKNVPVQWNVKP